MASTGTTAGTAAAAKTRCQLGSSLRHGKNKGVGGVAANLEDDELHSSFLSQLNPVSSILLFPFFQAEKVCFAKQIFSAVLKASSEAGWLVCKQKDLRETPIPDS